MKRKFYKHQLSAFKYTRREPHPALFMEMRLGKTLVTIRQINLYTPRGTGLRVLVVAPGSAIGSWEEELQKENEYDYVLLSGTKANRLRGLRAGCKWNLINKEGFISLPEMARVKWDAVVVDESVFIKNPKARVTQFFLNSFRNCPHRWILTGTPNPEHDLEFWTQLAFLDGKAFGCVSYWHFRSGFFRPYGHEWSPRRGTNKKVQDYVAQRCFVLNRKEVGIGPKKVYQKRYIELPPKIRKVYETAEREFILEYGQDIYETTIWKVSAYQWLRQICGGFARKLVWDGKLKELVSLLSGELHGQSVVVWYNYNQEIFASMPRLNRAGIRCDAIYGAIPTKKREAVRRSFQSGHVQVLLAQRMVADMGMNLSAADTAIYFSNPCGLLSRKQTEDRILSVEKKAPLLYIDLLVKNSVDEDVLKALNKKKLRSSLSLSKALVESMQQRRVTHGKGQEAVQRKITA